MASPKIEVLARLKAIDEALSRSMQLEKAIYARLKPLRTRLLTSTMEDEDCVGKISTELLAVVTEDLHMDATEELSKNQSHSGGGNTISVLELWKEELRRRIFDNPFRSKTDSEAFHDVRDVYVAEHDKLERILAQRFRLMSEKTDLAASQCLHRTSSTEEPNEISVTATTLDDFQLLTENIFAPLPPRYFWPEISTSLWTSFQTALQNSPQPPSAEESPLNPLETPLSRKNSQNHNRQASSTQVPINFGDLTRPKLQRHTSSSSVSAIRPVLTRNASSSSTSSIKKLFSRSTSEPLSSSWSSLHSLNEERSEKAKTLRKPNLTIDVADSSQEENAEAEASLPELLRSLSSQELEASIKEHIFYGGVSHELRGEVWKYLCEVYPHWFVTPSQRETINNNGREYYRQLSLYWQHLLNNSDDASEHDFSLIQNKITPSQLDAFKRKIDKDVVRTDQESLFFAGPDNPNVQKLRRVLLSYMVFNPSLGYVQGMSDLLAPFLSVTDDEADAFWCFVGFMNLQVKENFEDDQYAMRRQMATIRTLLQIVDPQLLAHCGKDKSKDQNNLMLSVLTGCFETAQKERLESGDLIFCFRWLVLHFKREFSFTEVLRLWEIIWSSHLTAQFHLFIALAMLHLTRTEIITKANSSHELLAIINNLSGNLDLDEVRYRAELLFSRVMAIWSSPDAMDAVVSSADESPNILVD